jgi:hypothetical protein
MDDSAARAEWGWSHQYDMSMMVSDMLENIAGKVKGEPSK